MNPILNPSVAHEPKPKNHLPHPLAPMHGAQASNEAHARLQLQFNEARERAGRQDLELLALRQSQAQLQRELAAALAVAAERGKELEQKHHELEAANEAAWASNRNKRDFLASMSHEIRTPMGAIIGMLSLLLDSELTGEQRDHLLTIRSASDALMTLINDILDISKIEAGKLELECIDFDLRTTIEEVLDLFAEQAYAKGIELAGLVHHEVPRLLNGDPGRIRQILSNLVSNALKFTDKGEVVVRVHLQEQHEGRGLIAVSVSDTGIGIRPEQRHRLFQPFSQADGSTTRRYGGTGLGLSICRQLCELMQGAISLNSQHGHGSVFTVTAWMGIVESPAMEECCESHSLRGRRLLIVEGNATNRKILQVKALAWNMHANVVESGEEAMRHLRAVAAQGSGYELILIDQQLADIEGMALAEKIKAEPELSGAHLILLTSIGQRGQGEQARRAGIAGYLTKPIRHRQLRDCMLTVLGLALEDRKTTLVTRHTLLENKARHRPCVLLAEDNPINQKVTVKMLERIGCRVDLAANGREAVLAVGKTNYQLVLMDCQMPRMNGLRATALIRRLERSRQTPQPVPIVAMTARAQKEDRERCLRIGMNDYLVKPARMESLREIIGKWTGAGELAEPLPSFTIIPDAPAEPLAESSGEKETPGEAFNVIPTLNRFIHDVQGRIADLDLALAGSRAHEAAILADLLKTACNDLGTMTLAEFSGELRELIGLGKTDQARHRLALLNREYERVRDALMEHLPSLI